MSENKIEREIELILSKRFKLFWKENKTGVNHVNLNIARNVTNSNWNWGYFPKVITTNFSQKFLQCEHSIHEN